MEQELKKIISNLTEREAKSILLNMLLTVNMHRNDDGSKDGFYEQMIDIFDEFQKMREQLHKKRSNQVVHIVFGLSAAGSLKMVLKAAGRDGQEGVIAFPGIFSIGPLFQLETEKGRLKRYEWMNEHINDYFAELEDQYNRFEAEIHQLDSIPEHASIVIWTANNAHEQTGLRFVHKLLQNRPNAMFHINTSKVSPVYLHTGEIVPEKLETVYEKGDSPFPLTSEEKRCLAMEWEELSKRKHVLRIWKNEKIKSVEESFFDPLIIDKTRELQKNRSQKDFIVCPRVVGEVLGHLNEYIGDEFIEYRIRELIYKGVFEIKGVPKAMRFYSIRLA
ncbi:DUF1835 domain-containing protein [Bacillus sonorensis]|uniref:DUF1835 domain-containing protein n=1 Tax=Bacillus sonorensis TaxID=119858 RepID=UPI00228312D8|nr:DUF1835 domain-containing protein [Bacillus sonorensis]MCZ0070064.1 DUF1835 domain-containing protein [Bacillus sonorensis]MCZ0097452.1 DUF1835 domain-containing protein [Bacillus sonorensis]MEC1516813.1 DUF1835 domain-containing protein [Bacillus sonorensis]